ncbi:MAG: large-conductance mechanosensitive channel protein MscL [Verrucomicrobiota bacterium]|jgi:large conductance mechanosensitive channel
MGMINEFKAFVMRGNVVDLAVGVIIGGAFGKIVGSVIEDLIMPVIGLAGNVDFSKAEYKLKAADPLIAGSKDIFLRYGNFFTIAINFIILAFCIFMVVKAMNAMKKKEEAAPAAPAAPSTTEKLLTEIRDSLRK